MLFDSTFTLPRYSPPPHSSCSFITARTSSDSKKNWPNNICISSSSWCGSRAPEPAAYGGPDECNQHRAELDWTHGEFSHSWCLIMMLDHQLGKLFPQRHESRGCRVGSWVHYGFCTSKQMKRLEGETGWCVFLFFKSQYVDMSELVIAEHWGCCYRASWWNYFPHWESRDMTQHVGLQNKHITHLSYLQSTCKNSLKGLSKLTQSLHSPPGSSSFSIRKMWGT